MMIIKRKLKTGHLSLCLPGFFLLILVVFAWCSSPARAAPVQDVVLFEDLHDHWARSYISRLSALELVKGYPDHTFKPDRLVSRLEAVVLIVRSGGLTAEAEQLAAKYNRKNSTRSTNNVETKQTPKVPWGQSYIDLAVEKGFLALGNPEGYDYAGPAARLEMAELLARAMYLVPPSPEPGSASGENKLSEGIGSTSVNSFSDQETLSPVEQAYIQAVANAGVMSGYPDGTFRPQEPLTRAEMAVILSRLVDRGWVKIPAGRRLAGWISGIEDSKGRREIVLTSLSGAQKLQVAKNVQCYRAGEEKTLEQAVNFRCEVILDGRRQASWINLLEQKNDAVETEKVRGSVKMVALGEDNLMVVSDMDAKDLILPLAWDAVLTGKKATKGFNSLKQGDFVDLEVAQGQVKKATILDVKNISGQVERIEGGRLYLNEKPSASKPGWFNYYDRARIVDKDGVLLGTVPAGSRVQVTYLDPFPGEIDDEIAVEIKVTN